MEKIKKICIILFIVSIFANLLLITQSDAITTNSLDLQQVYQIADIDPRKEQKENCTTISDKARCIAGGVLEAVIHLSNEQGVKLF